MISGSNRGWASVFRKQAVLSLLALLLLSIQQAFASSAAMVQAHAAGNQSLFWGTYRPNVYFGTRTRSADTLLTGLMWFGVKELSGTTLQNIRHTCEQGDDLSGYAWQKHDGRSFGSQEIADNLNHVSIKTEYLKSPGGEHGGDWAVRVSGRELDDQAPAVSLVFYVALDGEGDLKVDMTDPKTPVLRGRTPELGDFTLSIVDDPNNEPPNTKSYPPHYELPDLSSTLVTRFEVPRDQVWKTKEILQKHLLEEGQRRLNTYSDPYPDPAHVFVVGDNDVGDANLIMFQKTLAPPFKFDVTFLSGSASGEDYAADLAALSGPFLREKLDYASALFDKRFEDTFHLRAKGYDDDKVFFAQSLLGNMMGGLGYFHGTSIVDRALEGIEEAEPTDFIGDSDDDDEDLDYFDGDKDKAKSRPAPAPKVEGPTSLFTAVPSRPFFPRGFLWDEGFHQLLIGKWDNDISLDILSHWAALIDDKGWVAREQILGDEARSKVPQEFQTQYPHFANPPTLIMSFMAYMERLGKGSQNLHSGQDQITSSSDIDVLRNRHLYDKDLAQSFLNGVYPKLKRQYEWFRETQWGDTTAGGRKSRSEEGYRWRGRQQMHTLTSGLDDYPRSMPPHAGELHVDLLSWVAFYAKTLKAIAVELEQEKDVETFDQDVKALLGSLEDLHWDPKSRSFADLSIDEKGRSFHVVHKGYISLFPMFLGLLPVDSPQLGSILDMMEDPAQLWTSYGLASLSKADQYYGTGENYWRGPIWININYLVLSSLYKNYMSTPGPHQEQTQRIYKNLRHNIIENVHKEYKRTGYVWEQYSSQDGEGKRSHPFTGWTALVTLIMAEQY
ncbi:mannosyl-oligosaccharide glucosidase [Powellomyces hirtus]|uniref:Mannosyl-oligosaccharide glucosidase n=1 Tax=Powellomyces hirtus TaxID=109895 RepID=A0A507EFS3_9FUNG|nr:mannosyl-oligosaccharide glucosidase [Powellomyces hirtus]